ncbi:IRX5 protein, partial [Eubucco bourcierii]|nr:IRX5 protein [Eubucco bourcierii]
YPQGYLYQPSASLALYSCPAYSTSVISGPRTDELGRSSSGSAFSPYAGSTAFTAPSPGYNSHLQYGTDPAAAAAAAFTSYVVREHWAAGTAPGTAASRGSLPPPLLGLLFVHIFFFKYREQKGARLSASPPNFPASPPRAASHCCWRQQRAGPGAGGCGQAPALPLPCHWRPPDLAPPGRSPLSPQGSPYDHTPGMAGSLGYHPYAAPLGSYPYGDPAYRKNATRDATATLKAWLNEHRKNPYPTKGEKIMLAIITKMTLTQVSTWHPLLPAATGTSVIHSPQQAALTKPKLWSLAEIATSADKAKEAGGETAPPGPAVLGGGGPSRSPPRPRSPPAQCPFPNGAVLPRPLYYTAPFYPGYTNYGSFGALHGHSASGPAATAPGAHFNGLNQTVLSRAESLTKDTKMIRSQSQVDLCKDSPYELKKGMSNI